MTITIIIRDGEDIQTARVNGWEAETHIAAGDGLAHEAAFLRAFTSLEDFSRFPRLLTVGGVTWALQSEFEDSAGEELVYAIARDA